VIDLHLHTTASDGTLAPGALVTRAAAAGLTTISVTDHDTTAGLAEAAAAAQSCGMTFVPGIEITAVEDGHDVHVLGYYFDPASTSLATFLVDQRQDRVRRVHEICARLATMGISVDAEHLIAVTADHPGRSIGRPAIADALVRSGHARDRDDAFARLIGRSSPAYVPRNGITAAEIIAIIRQAGGVASLAHPILAKIDHLIPSLASNGLTALEARHPDQDPDTERRYRTMASELGLAVSGGSDFHGDGTSNAHALGVVTLDSPDFDLLTTRARARH
jgi:predicted metal-dependent phosphoesterase TrpH